MSKLIKTLIGIGAVIFIILWMMIPYLIEKPVITTDYFTQYNDLLRPEPYNEADNVATLLSKLPSPELTEEEKKYGGFSDLPDFMRSYEYADYPGAFKPEDLIAFKDWIRRYQTTLQAIVEASRKPYYYKPVDSAQYRSVFLQDQLWDYNDNTPYTLYDLDSLLSWTAVYHLEEGDTEKAIEYIEATLNFYKHLNNAVGIYQQWLVDQLIDSLDYIILYADRKDTMSPETLLRLQQLFSQVSDISDYDVAVQRLIFQDFIQKAFTQGDRGHLVSSVMLKEEVISLDFEEAGSFFVTIYKCIKCEHRKQTVDRMEAIFIKLEQWKGKSPYQLHEEGIDYEQEIQSLTGKNFLIEQQAERLLDHFQRPHQTACKMEAIAAIAVLRRYHLDTGHYPDSLEALLQDGYIDHLPRDCYSDGPLVYRKQDDDFILYSRGVDFEDDGGQQSLCPHCGDHFVDWGDGPVKKPDPSLTGQEQADVEKDAKGDHLFWPVPKDAAASAPLPIIM